MLFNSIDFLLFFPIVCIIYFLIPSLRWRNLFLLLASYFFYMNWKPAYALLLLTSTVLTYATAICIDKSTDIKKRKAWLTICIVLNLSILFVFKYFNFAAENITALMSYLGVAVSIPEFKLLLPVGISFYIFQALGYSIDVYRGNTAVERNFFTYALFVSFFPQLVAGPIERSTNLLQQFKYKHTFDYDETMQGLRIMAWGYFLKLALADNCGNYVDAVYNNLYFHNGGSYLLATFLFSLQIYGDFAGYTFIAIGAARVMGFHLMDNFRRPYFSVTVSEFWRRWHISFSSWLKDYIYIPLGGSRAGTVRAYVNVIITFTISGLWHGANWTFVMWGFLHSIALCIEKFFRWNKTQFHGMIKFVHWLGTFLFVAILSRIFFRANDISDAWLIISRICTDIRVPYIAYDVLIKSFMAIVILLVKECNDEFGRKIHISDSKHWIIRHLYFVFIIVYILLFGVLNSEQFIYFQF